jgi:hypothetical protein
METKVTIRQAKAIIKDELDLLHLSYSKLTAKTVDFSDLARRDRHALLDCCTECVFVKIHGFPPNAVWDDLKALAKQNGFCIQ